MRKLLVFVVSIVSVSATAKGFASGEEIQVLSAVGMRQAVW